MTLMQRLESLSRTATPVVGLGGEAGGIFVTGAATRNGEFKAIQVLEDASFSTVVGNIEGLSGASVSAGQIIHGLFTSVTITSGTVLIYRS